MITVLLVLLGLIGGAPCVQDDESAPRCIQCKQVGLLPCGEHRGLDLELEHDVLYCSYVAGCETCGGTGFVDCDRCENHAAEKRDAEKRAALGKVEEGLKPLDEAMKRELRKAESEHFVLVWEIDDLKVGRKRLDAHELLHLYLARMEELYDAYTTTFGVQEPEFKQKFKLFVWSFLPDHLEASKVFCGSSAEKGVKMMGANPAYSVAGIKRFFKGDEELHRNLVHSATHLLTSHQRPSYWVGQTKGGWADEGVSHWFEDKFFGVCDNYCYQEVNTTANFKGGKWRPAVRKLVASDDAAPAASVMQKNTTILTPAEHALAFSYVDFLIAKDAAKMNTLFQRLRSKVELRDALQETFGWNVLQFEAAWKAWVLETYPTR